MQIKIDLPTKTLGKTIFEKLDNEFNNNMASESGANELFIQYDTSDACRMAFVDFDVPCMIKFQFTWFTGGTDDYLLYDFYPRMDNHRRDQFMYTAITLLSDAFTPTKLIEEVAERVRKAMGIKAAVK